MVGARARRKALLALPPCGSGSPPPGAAHLRTSGEIQRGSGPLGSQPSDIFICPRRAQLCPRHAAAPVPFHGAWDTGPT